MSGYIDFHSHILPEVDDGSSSLEESYAMLLAEARQGVEHVVATPHFYARRDSVDGFLHRRREAAKEIARLYEHDQRLPDITLAAEVYYFPGISETDILPRLTIGGGRYILIEMPKSPWTDNMYRELARIYEYHRLIPVLAHIDRYISPLRTHGIPKRLAELPVLVQANASFFTDRYTSGQAFKLLSSGMIHLLGSDCHNMDDRKPNLGPAMQLIAEKMGRRTVKAINSRGAGILDL